MSPARITAQLGLDWADKKSICNKFATTSAVTAAVWPSQHNNEIVFGCADGKVRIGVLRSNKAIPLYSDDSGSYVCAMTTGPDGRSILVGHVDGSIYRCAIEGEPGGPPFHMRFATHSCAPYALAWGVAAVAGGPDGRVCFYEPTDGSLVRTFDYGTGGGDDDGAAALKDLTCASFTPSGEAVVIGSYDRFLVFSLGPAAASSHAGSSSSVGSGNREWVVGKARVVNHMYAVTALGWKADGSRLAVGNVTGCVDTYDACLKRTRYKDKFEFTYTSPSSVIVKRLATGMRIVLRSSFGYEILKIWIYSDRYLIAHTPATLLMGDLDSCKLSEVPWTAAQPSPTTSGKGSKAAAAASNSSAKERFFFDNPSVCMVYRAGELTLVEYGKTEVLGVCRTEHMSRHLVSVRVNERLSAAERERLAKAAADQAAGRGVDAPSNKKIAYLMDAQTIHVLDLATGAAVATTSHDARIDWLELSGRGSFLLFRDKRRRLYVYDCVRQVKSTLLSYANYAQWVPDSDVVVAQRRNQLCIWYTIRSPEKMSTLDIKGDVEEIERGGGKTEVVVDEGLTTASYLLDETLIGFGTAMDDGDLEAACATLESMTSASSSSTAATLSPEIEAMWQQLGQEAMRTGDLSVAQRCAVALGDLPRARFLAKTLKIANMAAARVGGDGRSFWLVRARLAQLSGDVTAAEGVLLEQGRVDDAVAMHQQLHRYDDAIAVAEAHGKPEAESMRHQYFQYLVDSGQEEKAGALKEQEGDSLGAISLYLRGGYPAKALTVALSKPVSFPRDVLERIVTVLATAGMYEKAGSLLERLGDAPRALEAYTRGHAYRPAVDLARRSFPHRVVELEKSWGDWLVANKQTEAAINHFIEAGAHLDAINAALNARQYAKAAQLVADTLPDPDAARPFWRRLAKVYADRGATEDAERYYVKAGDGRAAVDLHLSAGRYDAAYRVARSCMPEGEVASLYASQAQRMEAAGNLRQAEKLYTTVRAYDAAISMYRRTKQYDSMVRLVAAHRPDLLKDTHLLVAKQLQAEGGSLRSAERHYVDAGQWEAAVSMFRQASQWEEATRVARAHGGQQAAQRVAYAQAVALGGDAGMKLLARLGLMEQAIDYACDTGDWERALEMAGRHGKGEKIPIVHFKRAMKLEDMGQYAAAEAAFIAAEKPREAVEMHLHLKDFASALRVAEGYDPASVGDVLEGQARAAVEAREYSRAEGLFLDAKRPELAIEAWFEARQYPEALRVAKQYLPNKVAEVTDRVKRAMAAGGGIAAPAAARPSHEPASPKSPDGRNKGRQHASPAAAADPVATAQMWEGSREYARAVDAYLAVTADSGHDVNTCIQCWTQAVQLASKHDKSRYPEVAEEVGHRLAEAGKMEAAGDLFRDIEQIDKAADCYVQSASWGKAREVVKGGPAKLAQAVEAAYKQHLMKAGDPDKMAAAGAVEAAMHIYHQQGNMEKTLEMASKVGAAALAQYLYPHAEQLVSDGRSLDVLQLLARYGAPPVAAQLPLYRRLVVDLFASRQAPDSMITDTRDVLYKVVAGLKKQGGPGVADCIGDYERLLLVVHYAAMRIRLIEAGLTDLACKVSISLLRFAGSLLPADRAFYDAGMACKATGQKAMALVLLNRFIDLCDAIEDGARDGSGLDDGDFTGSGIPRPGDMQLPKACSLSEKQQEEAKDWVLAVSMDRKVEQSLARRPCFACGTQIFEASLGCPGCKASFPSCVVTGYPIPASQLTSCGACGSKAIKSAWNATVGKSKACPWCSAGASTAF